MKVNQHTNFHWVLVDKDGKSLGMSALNVLPKTYFADPSKIRAFNFYTDCGYAIRINLITGMFCIDGCWLNPATSLIPGKNKFKLIYRLHWGIELNVNGGGKNKKILGFKIGWETKVDNAIFQRILYINAETGVVDIRIHK